MICIKHGQMYSEGERCIYCPIPINVITTSGTTIGNAPRKVM